MTIGSYPTSIIPANPSDANFESDFRTNTEGLMTATKLLDAELESARSDAQGATYSTLDARLEAIENQSGATAAFWTTQSGTITGAQGASTFTVNANVTSIFTVNRAVALTSSGGVQYGFVSAVSYSSPNTSVTVVSDNAGTALTFSNALTQVQYASLETAQMPLIQTANLAQSTTASLNATSVAMAVALAMTPVCRCMRISQRLKHL